MLGSGGLAAASLLSHQCHAAVRRVRRSQGNGEAEMAKIPAGVGPKLPQIVVLFGATGDLSQRKLLPGLFHLITSGYIRKCRIIGVSLDDITTDDFRALARKAVEKHHDHPPAASDWPALDAALDYVPIKAGAGALKEAVDRACGALGETASSSTTSACLRARRWRL